MIHRIVSSCFAGIDIGFGDGAPREQISRVGAFERHLDHFLQGKVFGLSDIVRNDCAVVGFPCGECWTLTSCV
jgi:hypothetical protein